MRYYIDSLERIQTASNLAYRLSQPQQIVETASNVSNSIFGYIKHPTLDLYAAQVDELTKVPIHQLIKDSIAQGNGISAYFDSFYLTSIEAQAKKDLILNSTDGKGNAVGEVDLLDILPSEWTETPFMQLQIEGWFIESWF